ncbi:MAG: M56 family metallopeptidase [Mycobacteriaceae bacterium]
MSALAFGILTLLLTGPLPAALAQAQWTYLAPRPALVLWQAIALAAVLSAFSCGLAIASRLLTIDPQGQPSLSPLAEMHTLGVIHWGLYVFVFALTLVIGIRLAATTLRLAIQTRARRTQHRMLLDLLNHNDFNSLSNHDTDLRVLEVAEPLAYCLPGMRHRVVLSKGTLNQLSEPEITAILAHERAHLRARHDLVLEAFTALHKAFPVFVRSKTALGSVRLLIELLADDTAVRLSGPTALARALVACAASTAPQGALAVGGPTTLIRIQRLANKNNSPFVAAAAYFSAIALLVIPTVAVAIPWLNEIQKLLGA